MDISVLKATIKRELPHLLQEDPSFKDYIIRITQGHYADKQRTDDLFFNILDELKRNREEDRRKWEEQNKKWEEWKVEDTKKWEEQNKENKRLHVEIMAQSKKFDRTIDAIGARWGMQSERAFRNALAGILEENFGVEVLNIQDYDETGEVFGRPEQIELDIIIKNGLLLICELKSSMSKSDIFVFERKAHFYEKRHQRKANGLLVISPMVEARAMQVAEKLGIKVYSDSSEVVAL